MNIKFEKMHGLGNDFMVIDALNQTFEPNVDQIKQWSDRRYGIGFDQLLLLQPSSNPAADFRYRIFNANGCEVHQCGNGARCLARYLYDSKRTTKKQIVIETAVDQMTLRVNDDASISVAMGVPRFEAQHIPMTHDCKTFEFANHSHLFDVVNIGNPHAVFWVDNLANYAIQPIAQAMQNSSLFPESVNVGFAQQIDRANIQLRVYERGVGETLACGSGACAAACIGIDLGLLNHQVNVQLTNGQLKIHWNDRAQSVIMTGHAEHVYSGNISL